MSQSTIDRARSYQNELVAIRHDIHSHPELGLQEVRTADLVAKKLEEWGIEVHRGVGITGVVGVLRNGNGQASVGLRADMVALPILEATELPYASQGTRGVMHACGHACHRRQRCWVPRNAWRRHATSTAPSTSSSNPPRKASAARWRC